METLHLQDAAHVPKDFRDQLTSHEEQRSRGPQSALASRVGRAVDSSNSNDTNKMKIYEQPWVR